MNNYIESVKEFHEKFNHPINNFKDDINDDIRKLRIKLLFEELEELAEATNVHSYFNELCKDVKHKEINNINKKEELDALCDIQYVLSGAVLALGYQEVFDDAFDEVQESNMSKMCSNMDEVNQTISYYKDRGFNSYYVEKGDRFIVLRDGDNKILKNINYKEADLEKFIK